MRFLKSTAAFSTITVKTDIKNPSGKHVLVISKLFPHARSSEKQCLDMMNSHLNVTLSRFRCETLSNCSLILSCSPMMSKPNMFQ